MAFARFVCKQLHTYLLTCSFQPCSIVLYSFCSFCYMYFLCDRKYQRTRHTGKIFTSALCSRRILRALGRALARHFRLPLVFRVLRNLICTAIQEKLYPRKSSNSPRTMAWKQAALRWIFQRCPLDKLLMLAAKAQTSLAFTRLHVTFRPWRGITFVMKVYRHTSRTFARWK